MNLYYHVIHKSIQICQFDHFPQMTSQFTVHAISKWLSLKIPAPKDWVKNKEDRDVLYQFPIPWNIYHTWLQTAHNKGICKANKLKSQYWAITDATPTPQCDRHWALYTQGYKFQTHYFSWMNFWFLIFIHVWNEGNVYHRWYKDFICISPIDAYNNMKIYKNMISFTTKL